MEPLNEMNPVPNQDPMNETVPPEGRPRLTFKQAVGACISEYATFSGRSRRSEYWWFGLFCLLLMFIPVILMGVSSLVLDGHFIMEPDDTTSVLTQTIDVILVIIIALAYLFVLIPSLAVQTRRLHDTGHSGWWIVWSFLASMAIEVVALIVLGFGSTDLGTVAQIKASFGVSVIGGIVMVLFNLVRVGLGIAIFIFSLQDSQRFENEYGLSPKYQ